MRRASMVTILLLAACGRPAEQADVKPVASVSTALVRAGDADESLAAVGVVEFSPEAERTLTAPLDGTLADILAPAGARVAAGQAVARLHPSPVAAIDLAKARADAIQADAARARAIRLRADGLASDADVEAAAAAAQVADTVLATWRGRSGGDVVLRAPSAGVVEGFVVERGGSAVQGAAVVRIGALGALRVRLGVEANRAGVVRPGFTVRLSPLVGGAAREGKVTSVDPRLDAQTRQAVVYVRAPDGAFAPGEAVRGDVVLGRRHGALLIPRTAVIYDGDQPRVFAVEGDAARRRDVTLGVESGDRVEVRSGLSAGQRIVVDGADAVEDGMTVREAPVAGPVADPGT